MGGLSSKLDEMVGDSKGPHTPKVKKVPFDPRSPSDDISRTPITMPKTPDSGIDTTPTDAKVVQVFDPRSPNIEVDRTPIMIEKKAGPLRLRSLRPNTEMKLDSFLCSSNEENKDDDQQDPRSPTIKVPRTPLEDKVLDLEFIDAQSHPKSDSDSDEESGTDVTTQENQDKLQESNSLVKKLFTSDSPAEKVRRPLVLVQNQNLGKTPRDLLQAKHCKNVEDEYNKNIRSLLEDEENVIKSSTEFVENI